MNISYPIIIYDGECAMCSKYLSVFDNLLAHKPTPVYVAKSVCKLPEDIELDISILREKSRHTIIYIPSPTKCYYKSQAILAMLQNSENNLIILFSIIVSCIPLRLRDVIYDVISRNRHKIFPSSSCNLITFKNLILAD